MRWRAQRILRSTTREVGEPLMTLRAKTSLLIWVYLCVAAALLLGMYLFERPRLPLSLPDGAIRPGSLHVVMELVRFAADGMGGSSASR